MGLFINGDRRFEILITEDGVKVADSVRSLDFEGSDFGLTLDASGNLLVGIAPGSVSAAFPNGNIIGFELDYVSATTISMGKGVARDYNDVANIVSDSVINIAITTSGANGLDTGSEAASTWYAVFIIADSNGVNPEAGLLSLSETSPTLPSGYDVFRRVGWIRNDYSGNILNFSQIGEGSYREYWYNGEKENFRVLNNGYDTTFIDVDCSDFCSPSCNKAILSLGFRTNTFSQTSITDTLFMREDGDTSVDSLFQFNYSVKSDNDGHAQMSIPINEDTQIFEYRVSDLKNRATIDVEGWTEELSLA